MGFARTKEGLLDLKDCSEMFVWIAVIVTAGFQGFSREYCSCSELACDLVVAVTFSKEVPKLKNSDFHFLPTASFLLLKVLTRPPWVAVAPTALEIREALTGDIFKTKQGRKRLLEVTTRNLIFHHQKIWCAPEHIPVIARERESAMITNRGRQ